MDERLLDEVFSTLRQVYERFLWAHHNHLDGHETLAAEVCKAQSEAVQESARAVAHWMCIDAPIWAIDSKEVGTCQSNT